jgi:hypothetical protein
MSASRGNNHGRREEGRQAARKIASGSATSDTTFQKVPKLEKKNKNRLPRREKKARQKAASLSSGGQHA